MLSKQPVHLLLLSSDPHMMERLTAYDRPFFGRADNLLLGPLNPAEVGGALGRPGGGPLPGRHPAARQGTDPGEPRCGLPAYTRVAVAAWVMRAATAAG